MAFETTGKLHVINDTKQVSERFSKREFVLEVADGKYPQFIQFELTGDRTNMIDDFRVGDELHVKFNIKGREWKSPKGDVKYFVSLDTWQVENLSIKSRGAAPSSDAGGGPDSLPF